MAPHDKKKQPQQQEEEEEGEASFFTFTYTLARKRLETAECPQFPQWNDRAAMQVDREGILSTPLSPQHSPSQSSVPHTYPEKGFLKIFHVTREIMAVLLTKKPIFTVLARSTLNALIHSVVMYCLSHSCPLTGSVPRQSSRWSPPIVPSTPSFSELDQRLHALSGNRNFKRFERVVLPIPFRPPGMKPERVPRFLTQEQDSRGSRSAPHAFPSRPTANAAATVALSLPPTGPYGVNSYSPAGVPPPPHLAEDHPMRIRPPPQGILFTQGEPAVSFPASPPLPATAGTVVLASSHKEEVPTVDVGQVCWSVENILRLTCPQLVEAFITYRTKGLDIRALRVGDLGRLHTWWWCYVRNPLWS